MPMNTTGMSFSSFGISCHKENSFRNSFRGKNDEVVKCSIGERTIREGANKQVISSQADSLIKISRIWADFFPANTSNQPI
ncbi:T3SS secreted effector EspM-like protein [Escherichia coli]|nr:T3SS secreted effector EspM-like protein [Escherichia coli]